MKRKDFLNELFEASNTVLEDDNFVIIDYIGYSQTIIIKLHSKNDIEYVDNFGGKNSLYSDINLNGTFDEKQIISTVRNHTI